MVRAAGDAAVIAAEREPTLAAALSAAVEAASEAVIRTPDQLPVLAEAGVVDAGGRGFELLLRGVLMGMAEAPSPGAAFPGAARGRPVVTPEGDAGWGYETMYLLTAREGTTLDIDRMRAQLQTMGDSVLVVGDARVARVHLHSERPDLALGYGLRRGTVSRVTVENMDLLSAGEREERAAELLSVPPSALARVGAMGGVPIAGRPVTAPGPARAHGTPIETPVVGPATRAPIAFGVVAVAAGPGIAQAFEAAGVAALVRGGQGENPSTGDLLAAIREAGAEAVVVLPNNPNVRLAAQQAAALSGEVTVHVVPTRNAAEGLAAMLAVDPRAAAVDNAERMRRAAAGIRTFSVTRAVRDATLGGRKVRTGDAIALDPDDGRSPPARTVSRSPWTRRAWSRTTLSWSPSTTAPTPISMRRSAWRAASARCSRTWRWRSTTGASRTTRSWSRRNSGARREDPARGPGHRRSGHAAGPVGSAGSADPRPRRTPDAPDHGARPAVPPASRPPRPARPGHRGADRAAGGQDAGVGAAHGRAHQPAPGARPATPATTTAVLADATGEVTATWFGRRFIERQLREGDTALFSGKVKRRGWEVGLSDPEFQKEDGREALHAGRMVPVYRLTEGLTPKVLRAATRAALDRFAPEYPESLPADLRGELPGLGRALDQIHFPDDEHELERARTRLAFDELLALQVGMVSRRRSRERDQDVPRSR